jgi:oligoribonuclease NrnB/cAMP/cGMP phosphodiesterase (DHH superfamily)
MKYLISRYNFEKKLISDGTLTVAFEDSSTMLTYSDAEIEESVNEMYHPIVALESLRKIMEEKHKSLLNCNGCRVDTSYRGSGRTATYLIENGKPAIALLDMFEGTNEISKLCKVDEHKLAYRKWLEQLGT